MLVRRTPTAAVLLALGLAAVLGCSRHPPTGKVQGRVTLAGRPVGPGKVFFLPDKSKGTEGPPAIGDLGSDGKYELSTFGSGDGAVVGHHRVEIVESSPDVEFGVEGGSGQPTLIPLRYADADTSGLTAEVRRGSNTRNFDLRP
jgi:hypothetical protein